MIYCFIILLIIDVIIYMELRLLNTNLKGTNTAIYHLTKAVLLISKINKG